MTVNGNAPGWNPDAQDAGLLAFARRCRREGVSEERAVELAQAHLDDLRGRTWGASATWAVRQAYRRGDLDAELNELLARLLDRLAERPDAARALGELVRRAAEVRADG